MLLPDGNGIELLAELKTSVHCQQAHMIFATAEEDVAKKVAAFSMGADDYLVKPYSRLELRARAERLMSREVGHSIFFDTDTGIRLNELSYKAFVETNGIRNELDLTPHEFKILNVLIRHPERIFSRNTLIDLIWGENVHISERTVDTHVSSLRRKLQKFCECVTSIRGEGYKWRKVPFKRTA